MCKHYESITSLILVVFYYYLLLIKYVVCHNLIVTCLVVFIDATVVAGTIGLVVVLVRDVVSLLKTLEKGAGATTGIAACVGTVVAFAADTVGVVGSACIFFLAKVLEEGLSD